MPLFRSKKKDDGGGTASSRASRSNSLRSVSSHTSTTSQSSAATSSSTLKGLFRSDSSKKVDALVNSIDTQLETKLKIDPEQRSTTESKSSAYSLPRLKKKVSTIAEVDGDDYNTLLNEEESDYDTDSNDSANSDSFDESTADSTNEEEEIDSDEEEEEHLHSLKAKGKMNQKQLAIHLLTIMGYCGMELSHGDKLTDIANEELARTYSLLEQNFKIHRLPPGFGNETSVIGKNQIELINHLKEKMKKISKSKSNVQLQYQCLSSGKTLYERYGVVKDVIGKGAYGFVKIIDPNPEKAKVFLDSTHVLYAVKELQKKKTKESDEKFADRVISEFVISSTLNCKHVVKTVDLMVTLPPLNSTAESTWKFSQVMECTPGGDLFTYLTTTVDRKNKPVNFMSLDEIDCFIKQIARGLKYLHLHGVAHCDLKLENVLIAYKSSPSSEMDSRGRMLLKLSDFGKSSVFKTEWDQCEQLVKNQGPTGSMPYIAPEEFSCALKNQYSLSKKDCWALGIIISVLFNIRWHYYTGKKTDMLFNCEDTDESTNTYSCGYFWETTELKSHHFTSKDQKYKDKVFEEYTKTRMVADYDNKTKEWLVTKVGTFPPFDRIFKTRSFHDSDDENSDDELNDDNENEDEDDLCELRRILMYKLLDVDFKTRITVDHFLKSDWMTAVECCV